MENESKSSSNTNKIFIILLVVAAFVIGMLWQKNQALEKGQGSGSGIITPPGPVSGTQPDPITLAKNAKPVSDTEHIRGDKNAPITWIEYSDLECPYCKQIHPDLLKLVDAYKGKVRWVFRHFPLESIHANAKPLAVGSECANELGGETAFWKFIDAVYADSFTAGDTITTTMVNVAQTIGVNKAQFQSCLSTTKYAQKISDEIADGTKAGIQGTPGNIIMNAKGDVEVIPGAYPYEQLKAVVERLLSK